MQGKPHEQVNDAQTAIERARLALYLNQRPVLWAGNLLLQGACVMLCWQTQSRPALLAWLATNVLLMAMRLRARRAVAGVEENDPARIRRWFARLTASLFVGGMVWGGGAVLFLEPADPLRLAAFLLILMGVSWGAVASLSMHFPAVVAFVAPVSLLTAARLAASANSTASMFAVLTVAFMAFTLLTARHYAHAMERTLRLDEENLRLLAAVTLAKEAAERESADKSRFLAALSHDVRQPLYAASLFLESLGDHARAPAARELHDSASLSLRAVVQLIDGLLEIAQLDHAPPAPQYAVFDFAALAGGLGREFSAEAATRGVALVIDCQPTPLPVSGDAVLLARVLRNLLANALRHSSAGEVCLRARGAGDTVLVEVSDTGVGIAPADQARIFDEYFQVGRVGREDGAGLGLGLAVVRRLSRLMGFSVHLDSAPGAGARFSFALPHAAAMPASTDGASDESALDGLHVLVVEDDAAVRAALAGALRRWGCVVSLAHDRASALTAGKSARRPLDIVLSDHRLPSRGGGIDVVQALRATLDAALPAVLISGEHGAAVASQARLAGLPLLTKPVDPLALREAILRAVE
ncbi:MAG: hybrid sensor histidine kinase/response regulator [Gammaproteobacteria bacterium]